MVGWDKVIYREYSFLKHEGWRCGEGGGAAGGATSICSYFLRFLFYALLTVNFVHASKP